jgi:hypothetical protein
MSKFVRKVKIIDNALYRFSATKFKKGSHQHMIFGPPTQAEAKVLGAAVFDAN